MSDCQYTWSHIHGAKRSACCFTDTLLHFWISYSVLFCAVFNTVLNMFQCAIAPWFYAGFHSALPFLHYTSDRKSPFRHSCYCSIPFIKTVSILATSALVAPSPGANNFSESSAPGLPSIIPACCRAATASTAYELISC